MTGKEDLREAHKYCSNRQSILSSDTCGCFYCLSIFPPSEIKEWYDDKKLEFNDAGQTAICPYCSVDSILGSASGYPITVEFLTKMHEHWFH
jgi:hypothetical protein